MPCKFLYKKNALSFEEYEAIREIVDVNDGRAIDFTWLSTDDVCMILKSVEDNRDAMSQKTERQQKAYGFLSAMKVHHIQKGQQ